jgi:hypothetical protein
VRLTVDAEEADRGRNRRLGLARRGALEGGERIDRALVADLPQRQGRIVLQRAIELRDGGQRVKGPQRLVVAERFNDGAAENILAARDLANQRLPDAVTSALACRRPPPRARARAPATNPGLLLLEARS